MWSCEALNGSKNTEDQNLCHDFHLVISILSLLYLVICFPIGLCYNGLLVLVNLCNKATMTMPDVYFVNIAIAGLIINAIAPMYLLGPISTKWALWNFNNEVYITLMILFNVSSLVIMYSIALLSLDYYIERALPRTYMSSVYNTKHVCGFIWGGAMLTSFSSLLFYICNHVSTKIIECSKMQNKEAADAIMVFIGYIVPAVAVLYALVLILRIRKEATPLDQDTGRLDPSVQRLLIAAVCTQFTLWTPYYGTLLQRRPASAVPVSQQKLSRQTAKAAKKAALWDSAMFARTHRGPAGRHVGALENRLASCSLWQPLKYWNIFSMLLV
ncbi:probable G-protein coupled receptor 146 isoform X2 [Crotalus tigris]|uniref:probable G-protein coupled receptor 146 isoform X2 n=1 Tax=Crotalus tigris TaxID=88082 RepID=UPI00192F473B|nr:probable G-protein coupled receptor 146 isoform X2 [Crotalus tigris]